MPFIDCKNADLDIPVFDVKSLRSSAFESFTGGRLVSGTSASIVRAIDNFSIELKDGDAVGVFGHNGSGKTTLLRLLSGIYTPTGGSVQVSGNVYPIIELGVGLEDELTGEENIRRILLLQSGKKVDDALVEEIAEFCELGEFLRLPVRTYSSGMMMRLVFSTFIFMKPEILLLDEFFSTGDREFSKKVERKMSEIVTRSSIFVFASHQIDLLANYCSRFILMTKGQGREISRKELLSFK